MTAEAEDYLTQLLDITPDPNTGAPAGIVAAAYEYDAYGNVVASAGDYAAENPIRFSTKYFDAETGLSYFGYRYYSATLGRWLTRDPIGERGGVHLYGFVENRPTNAVDLYGLLTDPSMCATPAGAICARRCLPQTPPGSPLSPDAQKLLEFLDALAPPSEFEQLLCMTDDPRKIGARWIATSRGAQWTASLHVEGLRYSGPLPPPTCTNTCHNPAVMTAFMCGEDALDHEPTPGEELYWARYYQSFGQTPIDSMHAFDAQMHCYANIGVDVLTTAAGVAGTPARISAAASAGRCITLSRVAIGNCDDAVAKAASWVPDKPGVFRLICHGVPGRAVAVTDDAVSCVVNSKNVARYLRACGHTNEPIELIACHAARGGPRSLAQALADRLRVPVTAADDFVTCFENGAITTEGKFIQCLPRECRY